MGLISPMMEQFQVGMGSKYISVISSPRSIQETLLQLRFFGILRFSHSMSENWPCKRDWYHLTLWANLLHIASCVYDCICSNLYAEDVDEPPVKLLDKLFNGMPQSPFEDVVIVS